MPFRYRCLTEDCSVDTHSPGIASAHESNDGHEMESYTVDQDGYTWQGIEKSDDSTGREA